MGIIKDEDYIKPDGDPVLLGWYRWKGRGGKWQKYHAFLWNHPRNYQQETIFGVKQMIRDACGKGWTNRKAELVQSPPHDKRCKQCIRELEKLGLL